MNKMKKDAGKYWVVFLIALLTRVFVWLFVITHPERTFDNDSSLYVSLASNLLDHHTFLSIRRTPIYPLFIAATYYLSGGRLQGVLFSQCVLDSLTATVVSFIFFGFFKDNRYSLVAGLICAFNPFAIYYSNMILTETLFTFLLVIMFYLLIYFFHVQRPVYLAISSGMLGLSMLCRPIALYIPLLILPGLFLIGNNLKKKVMFCILFILCFSAVVTPWYLRNHRYCHRWILSTIDEINYFISFAPEVLMIENNPLSVVQIKINEPILHYGELLWSGVKSKYGWRENSPYEVIDDAQRVAILGEEGKKVILGKPLTFLASHLINIPRTLFPYYPPFSKLTGSDAMIFPILSFIVDLLTMVFFVLGSFFFFLKRWLSPNSNKALMYIMMAMIIYFSFIPGVVGYSRFRVPVLPYICILSSVGLREICQLVRSSYKKTIVTS